MGKIYKGAYAAGTSYSVGDVVKENGFYYILQKSASSGTHPTNTKYWGLISDPVTIDALDIAEESANAISAYFPNEKELVLKSSSSGSTKKYKITVIDNGTVSASEIS